MISVVRGSKGTVTATKMHSGDRGYIGYRTGSHCGHRGDDPYLEF